MLPSYGSAEREKMQRQGYANGSPSFPLSNGPTFNIAPHRFQPRAPPTSRRRKQLIARIAIGVVGFFVLLIFVPTFRSLIFTILTLGLAGKKDDDFHIETVRYYDLSNSAGTARGWENEERVLICAPLRDAASHLPMFFAHLKNMTYPHNLIDLAFLVGDSTDNTLPILENLLQDLQANHNPKEQFGEISIIEKDFGQVVKQDVESRHGFAAQAGRRKSMAQARNWLLSAALRPVHSWVYWRDVDVESAPATILEDLMRHNKDVIVPNVWRPLPDWLGGEQPYDLNSWQESETALALADTLDEDAVIVEGYAEYATWRPHLAYLRDPFGDPDMELDIDGVGGVSILAKAKVFRSGVHFPAFSFEKHAETEGFGKMAKRMQYSVVGLPHYTIWHLYEPSVDDIRHMEEMEQQRVAKEEAERKNQERAKKIQAEFNLPKDQWDKDKDEIERYKQSVAQKEQEEKQKQRSGQSPYGPDGKARPANARDGNIAGGKVDSNKAPQQAPPPQAGGQPGQGAPAGQPRQAPAANQGPPAGAAQPGPAAQAGAGAGAQPVPQAAQGGQAPPPPPPPPVAAAAGQGPPQQHAAAGQGQPQQQAPAPQQPAPAGQPPQNAAPAGQVAPQAAAQQQPQQQPPQQQPQQQPPQVAPNPQQQ